jgi:hypothetical protein
MQTELRSDIQRHRNSQKTHLRKGSVGVTGRRVPIVITIRIIGGLDIISIITLLHPHPHFLIILLYFLDLIVELQKFPSIITYPIYIHIMRMLFPSMSE